MINFTITKRFMTTPELAEYLAVSEDAIRNWVKRGEIPFSKLGRALRFDLLIIEQWLKVKAYDPSKIAVEARI